MGYLLFLSVFQFVKDTPFHGLDIFFARSGCLLPYRDPCGSCAELSAGEREATMDMETSHVAQSLAHQPLWQDPAWLRALSLRERAGYFPQAEVTATARRQLELWQEQRPFEDDTLFAARLASDGVPSIDALLALLSEDIAQVSQRVPAPPTWLLELDKAFAHAATLAEIPQLALPQTTSDEQEDPPVLLRPLWPILLPAVERLREGLREIATRWPQIPLVPADLEPTLLASLSRLLLPKVSRTLVLELHVAGLRGSLEGATSEERFASYIRLLEQPERLRTLLNEYAVLARQLVQVVNQWADYHLEWLQHLGQDWEVLRTQPGAATAGTLQEVHLGAGDTHRGGRSVVVLGFASGWKLVYKPRSLTIDEQFQALLGWLNAQANGPDLRQMWIVTRESHGWCEWIEAQECTSEQEVERFYERVGAYVALLYSIDAADFHYENVLATGAYPMLIDLEGLFHPHDPEDPTQHPGERAFLDSVLRIGILPARFWADDQSDGIDISGLGGQGGQMQPRPAACWEAACTDTMHMVRQHVLVPGKQNRPRLHGQEAEPLHYSDALLKGFRQTYHLLMVQRQELIEAWLPRFADVETRFVARPTRLYGLLLFESFHPNQLRNALRRERTLDRLWRAVPERPFLQRLIPMERADLLRGDIPLFTTRPGSRDLLSSQGECLTDLFSETSLQRVERRLRLLSEEDLVRQDWLIRASLTSLAATEPGAIQRETSPELLAATTQEPVSHQQLLDAACAVGDQLCQLATCYQGAASWLGIVQTRGYRWDLQPADSSLYHGNSGITLFLAYLGSVTGNARYTDLARAALKAVRYDVALLRKRPRPSEVGAFIGLGSVIYLLTHLGVLWEEPDLFAEARELVPLLDSWIASDERLDLMAGSAGAIISLLNLYDLTPAAPILMTAVRCGDHLLERALHLNAGLAWPTIPGHQPPAGLAHGNAGFALSLFRLADASGQKRFLAAAQSALDYERSLFSPQHRNWPVFRTGQAEPIIRVSWAHGAPGIGLARLASLPYTDHPLIRNEIALALETTIAEGAGWHHEGFGPNLSLSHGDFGNLETLLMAVQTLDATHTGYRQHLDLLTGQLLRSIKAHGWVTGIPLRVETPGLMIGLAGIGYELLRLAEPASVPSVLALASPSLIRAPRENARMYEPHFV